jgi:L-lactate dehydrogenase complex protein LldG
VIPVIPPPRAPPSLAACANASYPDYTPDVARSAARLGYAQPLENFRANFEAAHGKFFSAISDFKQFLLAENGAVGYCDPALCDQFRLVLSPEIKIVDTFDRSNPDICAFGITRAVGAIAESGTVILNDAMTSNRLGALAPWIHLAVVPKDSLHITISDAIATLGDDPNVVWVTGPSKTADIEGILVEGVHGPGIQACLFL